MIYDRHQILELEREGLKLSDSAPETLGRKLASLERMLEIDKMERILANHVCLAMRASRDTINELKSSFQYAHQTDAFNKGYTQIRGYLHK